MTDVSLSRYGHRHLIRLPTHWTAFSFDGHVYRITTTRSGYRRARPLRPSAQPRERDNQQAFASLVDHGS